MGSKGGLLKSRDLEARRVSEAMRDLTNVFRARFEEEFRASGVTLAQLRLLKAVASQEERSAASIARECHVTPQTLHTMLTRAVREGWITRGSTERNGRFVTATLTARGEALLQQGVALKTRAEAEMWRDIPAKAIQQVRKTLEAGLANLRRMPSAGTGSETEDATQSRSSRENRSHPSR